MIIVRSLLKQSIVLYRQLPSKQICMILLKWLMNSSSAPFDHNKVLSEASNFAVQASAPQIYLPSKQSQSVQSVLLCTWVVILLGWWIGFLVQLCVSLFLSFFVTDCNFRCRISNNDIISNVSNINIVAPAVTCWCWYFITSSITHRVLLKIVLLIEMQQWCLIFPVKCQYYLMITDTKYFSVVLWNIICVSISLNTRDSSWGGSLHSDLMMNGLKFEVSLFSCGRKVAGGCETCENT